MTRRVDVGILVSANSSIASQLRRVAAACVCSGLRVEFYIATLGPGYTPSHEDYVVPGVRTRTLNARWRNTLGRYPSPLVWAQIQSDLSAELRDSDPECVVSSIDSFGVYRLLHHWAQTSRRVSLVIQEGMAASRKRSGTGIAATIRGLANGTVGRRGWLHSLIPHRVFMRRPLNMFATYACVWGEAMRRALVSIGRSPNSVFVTGSPAFDDVTGRQPLRGPAPATVLFAHQPVGSTESQLEFLRLLVDICANSIGCRLLIKRHPRSEIAAPVMDGVIRMATRSSELASVIDEGRVEAFMKDASVFLTFFSTSAYRAIVDGVPLVLADYISDEFSCDLAAYGAAIPVDCPGRLESALREALFDEAARRRLYDAGQGAILDHLHLLDGKAGSRIAQVVTQLIGGSRN